MRNRCERLSELLDWNTLGREYTVARGMAVERTFNMKVCMAALKKKEKRKSTQKQKQNEYYTLMH